MEPVITVTVKLIRSRSRVPVPTMQGNVRRLVRSIEPPGHAGGSSVEHQDMLRTSSSPQTSSSPAMALPLSLASGYTSGASYNSAASYPVNRGSPAPSQTAQSQTPTISSHPPSHGLLSAYSRPDVSSFVREVQLTDSPAVTSSSQPIISHIDAGGDELYSSIRKSLKRSDGNDQESQRRQDPSDDEWFTLATDVLSSLTALDASSLHGVRVVSEDDLRVGSLISLYNVLNPYLLLMRDDGQQDIIGMKFLFHFISNKENFNIKSNISFKHSQFRLRKVSHTASLMECLHNLLKPTSPDGVEDALAVMHGNCVTGVVSLASILQILQESLSLVQPLMTSVQSLCNDMDVVEPNRAVSSEVWNWENEAVRLMKDLRKLKDLSFLSQADETIMKASGERIISFIASSHQLNKPESQNTGMISSDPVNVKAVTGGFVLANTLTESSKMVSSVHTNMNVEPQRNSNKKSTGCFSTRRKNSSHSHVEPPVTDSPSSRRPLETTTLPHHAPPSTSSAGILEIVQDMRNTLTWLTTGNGLSSWSSGSVNVAQVHQRIVVMGDVPTDSGHMISPLSSSSQLTQHTPNPLQLSKILKYLKSSFDDQYVIINLTQQDHFLSSWLSRRMIRLPVAGSSPPSMRSLLCRLLYWTDQDARDMRSLFLLHDCMRRRQVGCRWDDSTSPAFVIYDRNGIGAAGRLVLVPRACGVMSCVLLLATGAAASALDALLLFIAQRTNYRPGQAGDPNVIKRFQLQLLPQQNVTAREPLAQEFVIVGPIARWITPSMQRYVQYFFHAQQRHGMNMYTTIRSAPKCRIMALKTFGTSQTANIRLHRPWYRIFSNNLLVYDHRKSRSFAEQGLKEDAWTTNLKVASEAGVLVEEEVRVELMDSVGMVDRLMLVLHLHSSFIEDAKLLEFSKQQLDVGCLSESLPHDFKLHLVIEAGEGKRESSTTRRREIFAKEKLPSQVIPSLPQEKQVPNYETNIPSSAYLAKTPADLWVMSMSMPLFVTGFQGFRTCYPSAWPRGKFDRVCWGECWDVTRE
ncbi:hypothetical protein GUITHDRAFT_144522 [Guillardia theta CCMP2712]|uniref:C2 tensin-type domain-containing protein n=1 Tax=Guillardia theta (strain CCMP2712) TaxID=905079 RepID=L1IPL2_GUITC|nr:hypothetical protein GUITHDRAFT_144522 [Guillardia theta CCMP2712]EKX38027.1 hypothetical protein GUITHDRAFT_144522 [Guillardia theta CCMP2712]|eukprot:XP_005825007.1 hypothetical protein GUITHDRAFT_144522 [Guillardia theta CCMP2712]